ncbi:hypothetical protein [Streptomyces sp. NPDC006691]
MPGHPQVRYLRSQGTMHKVVVLEQCLKEFYRFCGYSIIGRAGFHVLT